MNISIPISIFQYLTSSFENLFNILAVELLLVRIWNTKSSAGISGKSQILLLTVSVTRYLDLLTNYVSLYNTVMKIAMIGTGVLTVYLIYGKFRVSLAQLDLVVLIHVIIFHFQARYEADQDTFRVEFLLVPCLLLALLINQEFSQMEVLRTFSIYLETVAILPQLFMIRKSGEAETFILHYLLAFGSYRGLYYVDLIHRYYSEGFYDLSLIFAGSLETIIYCAGGLWCLAAQKRKEERLSEQYFQDCKVFWDLESQASKEEQEESTEGLKEYKEEVQNEIEMMQLVFLCLLTWSILG